MGRRLSCYRIQCTRTTLAHATRARGCRSAPDGYRRSRGFTLL
jgi:hypothetical protein